VRGGLGFGLGLGWTDGVGFKMTAEVLAGVWFRSEERRSGDLRGAGGPRERCEPLRCFEVFGFGPRSVVKGVGSDRRNGVVATDEVLAG
jgi:hypothetical protein